MKLIQPVRMIIAAVVFVVIAQVLHQLSTIITMDYYIDPDYFPVWSKIMMPGAGPPPAEFFYYSVAFSFVTGLIFSFVYSRVESLFKNKNVIQKGVRYGFGIFIVTGIPFFLSMYLLINLPLGLLASWLVIDGLMTYLVGGIAIAKLIK